MFFTLLPPAIERWGKVIFSFCVSVHTRGNYPLHQWRGGEGWGVPPSANGRYPYQVLTGGVPPSFSRGGTPIGTGWGTPQSGLNGEYPLLGLDGWCYPPPPSPVRKLGDRAATQRAVCLLPSRGMTFLFIHGFIGSIYLNHVTC